MIKLKKSFHHSLGFTLIELLVVISIIGILAAVMLLVINPTRIQNRAKNAAIKSTMSKVGFAINGAMSANAELPSNNNILNEIENSSSVAGTCSASTSVLNCTLSIPNPSLPTGAVGFRVLSTANDTATGLSEGKFRVVAHAFPLPPENISQTYVYDSSLGMYLCPRTGITDALGIAAIRTYSLAGCVKE